MEGWLPGTAIPHAMQQAWGVEVVSQVTQALISVLPSHSAADLSSLQQADPVIREVLPFWKLKVFPSVEERRELSKSSLILLHQWDRFVDRAGVLYRWVFRPDGGEEFYQLILPTIFKSEVLTKLHREHGHQGIE